MIDRTLSPRWLAGLLVAGSLVALGTGPVEASARSDWAQGWYEGAEGFHRATEEAAETDRPVFVYFYTDWCGYCRQLERELLPTQPVQNALADMIKVRINPEHGPRERGTANRYGVRSYPALFMHPPGLQPPRPVMRGIRDRDGLRLQTPEEFGDTLRAAAQ